MKTTDQYICELLSKDNKQGMNLLFKKYFESLVIWADTFLNDLNQSQDLVQELFVNIWRKKSYHNWNPDKLPSYLHVAVKNACYNKLKKVDVLSVLKTLVEVIKNAINSNFSSLILKKIVSEGLTVF